jgi:hypothetical protein
MLSSHFWTLEIVFNQTDRTNKANYSYSNDGEKSHVPSLKNLPPIVPHEAFFSSVQNDYSQTRLVPLDGCSASEASQFLSDRKFFCKLAHFYSCFSYSLAFVIGFHLWVLRVTRLYLGSIPRKLIQSIVFPSLCESGHLEFRSWLFWFCISYVRISE